MPHECEGVTCVCLCNSLLFGLGLNMFLPLCRVLSLFRSAFSEQLNDKNVKHFHRWTRPSTAHFAIWDQSSTNDEHMYHLLLRACSYRP